MNGMQAVVEAYDLDSGCLEVITATGKRHSVYRTTEDIDGAWPHVILSVTHGLFLHSAESARDGASTHHGMAGCASLPCGR